MELDKKKTRRAYGDGGLRVNSRGKYEVTVEAGKGMNGKRKRSKKIFNTEREARQALKEMHAKKLENRLQSNESRTLRHLYEQWEKYGMSESLRDSTRQDYIYLANRYVLPALGHKRLVDIDVSTIDMWLHSMQQNGLSAITRKKARQNAYSIFKFGIKHKLITNNPVSGSLVPKKDKDFVSQVQEPLTKKEWIEYLEKFRETPLDTFVHIGAMLGLRRGEIVGLSWSDIDFETNYLHVRHSARENTDRRPDGSSETKLVLNDPKTKHSRRKLEMNPALVDSLRRQKVRQNTAKLAAGSAWVETNAVFTSSVGTRLYPSNVHKQYKKLTKDLGLRYVRIHDLRHTVAHLLLDDEVPLESVSRLLGHSSLSITMDIYAQNVQSVADRGARGMSDLYEQSVNETKSKKVVVEPLRPIVVHKVPVVRANTESIQVGLK
jgi:integrase